MKKQVFSQILLSLVIAPLFGACVQVTNDEDQESNDRQATQQASQINDYEVIAGEPNQYKVLVVVPDGTQVVQRESSKTRARQQIGLQLQEGRLLDESPEPGTTQTYHMGYIQNGTFQTLKSIAVEIPMDLEVKGDLAFSSDTNWSVYSRIFLYATITTNGHQFLINTQLLHSEGGAIQTFPGSASAIEGSNGRGGGFVKINAQTVSGVLHMLMIGENGGKANVSTPGGNGGNSGSFWIQTNKSDNLQLQETIRPGAGGGGFASSGAWGDFNIPGGKSGKAEISRLITGSQTKYY